MYKYKLTIFYIDADFQPRDHDIITNSVEDARNKVKQIVRCGGLWVDRGEYEEFVLLHRIDCVKLRKIK